MGKRAPSLWAWTPTAWGPEEPPFPRKHKQRLKLHAGSSRWSTAMISELMVLQWPVRCPASGLITRQGLVGDTQNSSETAGLQMESIFICNRINNNTGLKPTDTTGLFFQPLQADHWIQGWFYFFVFKQDRTSMRQQDCWTASREFTSDASVLPTTGCLKCRGQKGKMKKYSLEESPEDFYHSD